MSLFSTPADLTASITRRICSELAASASLAVDPWVWTPIVNAASSGTEVMVPTPVTVMPPAGFSALPAVSGRPTPAKATIAAPTATRMSMRSGFMTLIRRRVGAASQSGRALPVRRLPLGARQPCSGPGALPRRAHSRRIVPGRGRGPRRAAGGARAPSASNAGRLRGSGLARRHRRGRLRRGLRRNGRRRAAVVAAPPLRPRRLRRARPRRLARAAARRRGADRARRVRAAPSPRRHRVCGGAGVPARRARRRGREAAGALPRRAEPDRQGSRPRARARSTLPGTSLCRSYPAASSSPTAAPASRRA